MRSFFTSLFVILVPSFLWANNVYYVATDGNDSNAGTIDSPFASLDKAHAMLGAGDTVYFRGGTYDVANRFMKTSVSNAYDVVFYLDKSGSASSGHIVYAGYPGERPVFDFSGVSSTRRVSAFYLHGSYIHLKNFEIVGVRVYVRGHTQSECISARRGSYCIVENLSMHDTMAIGYYQTAGHNNLVLNCDAYNNFDDYSCWNEDGSPNGETRGGNNDGFGFHCTHLSDTANVIRGCRAWFNTDDGYDLINCKTAVTIDSCWAFYNGYAPLSATHIGDGNGFKAGGYGAGVPPKGIPEDGSMPQHRITHCLSFYNYAGGFYANHHMGGNYWQNNTAMMNASNYNMLNRDSSDCQTAYTNVDGYGHIESDRLVFGNNICYNLQGQQICPSKGFFIACGRKMLLR